MFFFKQEKNNIFVKKSCRFYFEKFKFFPKMWEFFQFLRISILLKWFEIKPFFQFFGKKEHFCVKVMSILCRKNNIFLKKFRNFAFFKNFQSREMVWNTVFFLIFQKNNTFLKKWCRFYIVKMKISPDFSEFPM